MVGDDQTRWRSLATHDHTDSDRPQQMPRPFLQDARPARRRQPPENALKKILAQAAEDAPQDPRSAGCDSRDARWKSRLFLQLNPAIVLGLRVKDYLSPSASESR